MNAPLQTLEIKNLVYHGFGPINLSVDPGECVCLTGDSGCGKTLLLRSIIDLEPRSGDVFLGPINSWDIEAYEWRGWVGTLPAESQWWDDHVGEHLPKDTPVNLFEQLNFAPDVVKWQVSRLSSGEKQRLAVIRLLSRNPRALLLDEPTANLDSTNTELVEAVIRDYRESRQTPVIWISHNLDQTRRVSSRRFRLENGLLRNLP